MGLPLFFGEQRAKIKASQIALSINAEMQSQYLSSLLSRQAELKSELLKYKETIDFYQTSGKYLSNQIITSSQKSYEMGEIDFYRFVLSIENALEMNVNYYDNVSKYNQVALEINYLTN